MASRLQQSPAQVLIAWSLQHGVVTIPKSTKAERVAENARAVDIVLDDRDMAVLDSMGGEHGSCGSGMRVVQLNRLQASGATDCPDGYKLRMFQNSFPSQVKRVVVEA